MDWGYIIVGFLGMIGGIIVAIINANANAQKTRAELREGLLSVKGEIATETAVTNTKIEELTREVRDHNGFARKIPVIEEQIKVANNRIKELEQKVG